MSTYPLITGQEKFEEQQPARNSWSATQGATLTRVWRGPTVLFEQFRNTELPIGYIELDITPEASGITTVRATYGSTVINGEVVNPDPMTTTWTMSGAMEQKHFLEHKKSFKLNTRQAGWSAIVEKLAKKYRSDVEAAIKNGTSVPSIQTFTWTTGNNPVGENISGATTDEKAWANYLYRGLIRNPDASFLHPTYVLKKTQTLSQLTQQVAAYAYVGYVISHTALTQLEPSLLVEPYSPDRILIGLAGLNTMLWHVQTPTTEQISRGKYQLTQEYFGVYEYDPFAYDYKATIP